MQTHNNREGDRCPTPEDLRAVYEGALAALDAGRQPIGDPPPDDQDDEGDDEDEDDECVSS